MANFGFGNEHFLAGEERRAREGYSYGNQTHTYGLFFGRIRPTELPLCLPARTPNTSRCQQKQGCRPVFYPDAHHALLAPALHASTGAHAQPEIVPTTHLL